MAFRAVLMVRKFSGLISGNSLNHNFPFPVLGRLVTGGTMVENKYRPWESEMH